MAWTAPITFVPETVLTASQLNIHIRDNLNEMAPAKASTPNSIFVTTARHQIREQHPKFDYISNSETTTSNEYTDLKEVGPEVETYVTFGALVTLTVGMLNSVVDGFSIAAFQVRKPPEDDGVDYEEVHAPTDERSIVFEVVTASQDRGASYTTFIGVPEPGMYSFLMKYRVTAGTGTFLRRYLMVIPF